jgi:IMP dehydrogenase
MKTPGDIAKAIAFGADMCMLGGMLAKTDLAPGDCYTKDKEFLCEYDQIDNIEPPVSAHGITGRPLRSLVAYKHYRGMASREAREGVLKKASVEGVAGLVKYEGGTDDFLEDLHQNLIASLSYNGSPNWSHFKDNVDWVRVSSGGWTESLTHVIQI